MTHEEHPQRYESLLDRQAKEAQISVSETTPVVRYVSLLEIRAQEAEAERARKLELRAQNNRVGAGVLEGVALGVLSTDLITTQDPRLLATSIFIASIGLIPYLKYIRHEIDKGKK